MLGGNQWGEVYNEMIKHNVLVVGGQTTSVGVTGYSAAGGHSSLGPKYGLAVDNILEIDIVLANGTLLTANSC